MPITRFDHYTIRSTDVDASWWFYEQVLDLSVRERTGFPVKAFIASANDVEVVHCFQATEEVDAALKQVSYPKSDTVTWKTGRLQHVEFWATDWAALKQRWDADGTKYTERTLPDKHQVGVVDPDEIVVNLNFPLSEVGK